jgi:hypothetical protein
MTGKMMMGAHKTDDKRAEGEDNPEMVASKELERQIDQDPERAKKLVGPTQP